VSHELKTTVQRLYIETIHKLDAALQNVCANFMPEEYGKVGAPLPGPAAGPRCRAPLQGCPGKG
jgi:hypothetical protein